MSASDEGLDSLTRIAVHATIAGAELDASHWPDAKARERALAVLAYTQLMIEGSDAVLISSVVASELEATLTEFVNAPEQLASESGPWVDRLLDLTGRLPRAQGRDFEQAAKKAATTFQRSAQQRFAAVEKRAEEAQSNVGALAENLEGQRAEINAFAEQFRVQQEDAAEARFAQIEARTQDLQLAAERHAQSIEALMTEQAEVFRKAQDERAEEHREREQGYQSNFELLDASTTRRADTLVSEIATMKDRSAELVGSIGITGTAERYGKEFEEQQATANNWRMVTLGLGALAAVAAIVAAFDHNATTAGTKLAIAVLVGGVAAYTARQSARHRSREEHARRLQLDLTAFPVFIEALPEEDKDAATVWMAERSFLGARSGVEDEDDGGPSVLSQVIARRKKTESVE
jgi:hypothetical protein